MMADDLNDRGPRDRSRINVNEDWELRYWTKELNCTPDELRLAIRQAETNSVETVRAQLRKK
jgi:hypothetical protein